MHHELILRGAGAPPEDKLMKPLTSIKCATDAIYMATACRLAVEDHPHMPPFLAQALQGARQCYLDLADDIANGRVEVHSREHE